MKLFISGGLGFIGNNFVRFALQQPEVEELMVFDAITYAAQMDTIEGFSKNPKFRIHVGDITNTGSIFAALKRMSPTHVIHFAAQTHVDKSIEDPASFFTVNVMGTHSLMSMLRSYTKTEKIIHVSTDEVYGSCHKEFIYDGDPIYFKFDEYSGLNPSSPYSASKAAAEMVCRSYQTTYQLPITIVRPTNNYGPYQNKEKLIPKIITNALSNQDIPIYGDGHHERDWLFVEDHVRALWGLLEKKFNGCYNIGAQNHIRNIDMAKKILSMIPQSRSKITFVKDRIAHDEIYGVTTAAIEAAIGWKPQINLDDGLQKTVDWYTSNAGTTCLGYRRKIPNGPK